MCYAFLFYQNENGSLLFFPVAFTYKVGTAWNVLFKPVSFFDNKFGFLKLQCSHALKRWASQNVSNTFTIFSQVVHHLQEE